MSGHPRSSPLFPTPPLSRPAAPAKPALTVLRDLVPARLQHPSQPAVLIPQPTVGRLDDDVLRHAFPPLGSRPGADRKSTRLNSSHSQISYAVFCLNKTNLSA